MQCLEILHVKYNVKLNMKYSLKNTVEKAIMLGFTKLF